MEVLPIACLVALLATPLCCVIYYNWRQKHPGNMQFRFIPRTPIGWLLLLLFIITLTWSIIAELNYDTSLPDSMYEY